jgi:hypothetical protein
MPANPNRAPWTPPLPLEQLTPPLGTSATTNPPSKAPTAQAQRQGARPSASPPAGNPGTTPASAPVSSGPSGGAATVPSPGPTFFALRPGAAAPAVRIWTMAELLQTTFPPPRQVVPDLLPVGLALFAGRPKFGKSFLILQLVIAVGSGGRFLGRSCASGGVFYLALEDGPARIHGRSVDLGAPVNDQIRVAFDWPPLNTAGLGALKAYMERYGPRLVVVDTLARAFTGRVDWDNVGQTTETMGRLQRLALDCDASIFFVDHHKKGNGLQADIVDDTLGSTGKTAVADVVWGIYRERGQSGATLKVTGRDIEDAVVAMTFDPQTCCWQTEQEKLVQPETLAGRIVQILRQRAQATTSELARLLERDRGHVNRELAVLVLKDVISRGERVGRDIPYRLNDQVSNMANMANVPTLTPRLPTIDTIDTIDT